MSVSDDVKKLEDAKLAWQKKADRLESEVRVLRKDRPYRWMGDGSDHESFTSKDARECVYGDLYAFDQKQITCMLDTFAAVKTRELESQLRELRAQLTRTQGKVDELSERAAERVDHVWVGTGEDPTFAYRSWVGTARLLFTGAQLRTLVDYHKARYARKVLADAERAIDEEAQ